MPYRSGSTRAWSGQPRRRRAEPSVRVPPIMLSAQRVEYVAVTPVQWTLYGGWRESELDTHIKNLVRDLGGLHHHISDSRKMGEAGLPDHLCLIPRGGGMTVYLEAKRFYKGKGTLPTVDTLVGGHVRTGQETWLRMLHRVGTHAYLVYPSDVPDLARFLSGYVTDTAMARRMKRWIDEGVWEVPMSPLIKLRKVAA